MRGPQLLLAGSISAVAAACLVPIGLAAPTCSTAGAQRAIRQTKPRLKLLADTKELITPDMADGELCFDVTDDGGMGMAVSLASGGTAGDVGWLLFVPRGSGWRLVGSGTGYKMGLFRIGSDLEVVQPVYRGNDPNCCPSGGFDRTLYRWGRSRLVVARTWHTKTFR